MQHLKTFRCSWTAGSKGWSRSWGDTVDPESLLLDFGDGAFEVDISRVEYAIEGGYEPQRLLIGDVANELIISSGLVIPVGSKPYRQFLERLCWAFLRYQEMVLKRTEGDWEPVKTHLGNTPLSNEKRGSRTTASRGFKPLSEVVSAYIDSKNSRGDWVYKSGKDAVAIFELLLEFMGKQANPNEITTERFQEFVDVLRQIPQRHTIYRQLDGLSLKKLIAKGEEMGIPPLSPSTVNKKFKFVKALFKFAESREWVDKDRASIIDIKVSKKDKSERLPFTHEDLSAIFKATHLSNPDITRPSDHRVPRIALTTGMRANEILQLTRSDIQQHEGIWYFDINEEFDSEAGAAKKVKSENSARKVPVPQVLIDSEFLEFVQSVEIGRLFSCVPLGADGTYSNIYSRRFNRVLADLGIKPKPSSKQMKDFHSFRHTFRANARRYGISQEFAELIGGWSGQKKSAGDGYVREHLVFLERLKECIDGIRYDVLDF